MTYHERMLRLADELEFALAWLPVGSEEFASAHKLSRYLEHQFSLHGITRALPAEVA